MQHTLYGLEALIYNISVLMLAASLALICTVDLTALADSWFQETMKSTFLCSMLLRIVTPLQSLSALFIADIGRYVGHTPSELQEIRCVHRVAWIYNSFEQPRTPAFHAPYLEIFVADSCRVVLDLLTVKGSYYFHAVCVVYCGLEHWWSSVRMQGLIHM